MENLRPFFVIAVTVTFVVLLLADYYDAAFGGGKYDVPGLLFGVIGTVAGAILADKVVEKIRR